MPSFGFLVGSAGLAVLFIGTTLHGAQLASQPVIGQSNIGWVIG
jgi:hypothetical protein